MGLVSGVAQQRCRDLAPIDVIQSDVASRCIFLVSRQRYVNGGLKFRANNERRQQQETAETKADMVIHPLWKKCLLLLNQTDSPYVNAENCSLYNAVRKRLRNGFGRHLLSLCRPRNVLKYGFYPAYFPRICL